jgi:hypothetical protein
MHELDLPRRYQTIYVCGSFGIGGTRQQNLQALERFYQHLLPGGVLLLDEQMPYSSDGSWPWKDWLAQHRQQLDPNFWTAGEFKRASDGSDYRLRSRLADLDPLEQTLTLQMRAELWRDEQLVKAEERTLTTNIYFKSELVLMLKHAGFAAVTVHGDYTEATATPEHATLVFIARKKAQ